MDLAWLLCRLWLAARPDYVIAIMPENQRISTDKLCRSNDLVIFATGRSFYDSISFSPNPFLPVVEFKGEFQHEGFAL